MKNVSITATAATWQTVSENQRAFDCDMPDSCATFVERIMKSKRVFAEINVSERNYEMLEVSISVCWSKCKFFYLICINIDLYQNRIYVS